MKRDYLNSGVRIERKKLIDWPLEITDMVCFLGLLCAGLFVISLVLSVYHPEIKFKIGY